MGAKQSKRSVDISGKEAESAGEVAASIAGGEGRLEQLADADALKPQLNGDAHIHETEEKLKDIDSGTPENEKDATTEKEAKVEKEEEKEKEVAPLLNGETEQKVENGDSTPEDGKKPKKEKVKKKWSLRSISFSRKDKPKQEKKAKDEEPKTNGETEKLPEETAEAAPEVLAVTEAAEEAKTPSEVKEDQTPETPVTEPITNGSSTPESPKVVETPVVEEPAAPSPESESPETTHPAETEPEQLPVNGLSLEEPAKETVENEKNEDSKEESIAETTEIVPEIPVKKEVCVEQMPLIDSTPPPLPANPPPSSVASFAATTMAPELTDASLANTAVNAIPPTPPSDPIAKDTLDEILPEPEKDLTVKQTDSYKLPSPVKEVNETPAQVINNVEQIKDILENIPIGDNVPAVVENIVTENETIEKALIDTTKVSEITDPEMPAPPQQAEEPVIEKETEKVPEMPAPPAELVQSVVEDQKTVPESSEPDLPAPPVELIKDIAEKEIENDIVPDNNKPELPAPPVELIKDDIEKELEKEIGSENIEPELPAPLAAVADEPIPEKIEKEDVQVVKEAEIPPPAEDLNIVEKLPTPPPSICTEAGEGITENNIVIDSEINSETIEATSETVVNSNHDSDTEEKSLNETELKNDNETVENLKNKSKDSLGNVIDTVECNGNIEEDKVNSEKETVEIIPSSNPSETAESRTAPPAEDALPSPPDSLPPPPPELCAEAVDPATPQEPLPVSDKLADLITEVPEVPELKTETLQETTSEAAVAN